MYPTLQPVSFSESSPVFVHWNSEIVTGWMDLSGGLKCNALRSGTFGCCTTTSLSCGSCGRAGGKGFRSLPGW